MNNLKQTIVDFSKAFDFDVKFSEWNDEQRKQTFKIIETLAKSENYSPDLLIHANVQLQGDECFFWEMISVFLNSTYFFAIPEELLQSFRGKRNENPLVSYVLIPHYLMHGQYKDAQIESELMITLCSSEYPFIRKYLEVQKRRINTYLSKELVDNAQVHYDKTKNVIDTVVTNYFLVKDKLPYAAYLKTSLETLEDRINDEKKSIKRLKKIEATLRDIDELNNKRMLQQVTILLAVAAFLFSSADVLRKVDYEQAKNIILLNTLGTAVIISLITTLFYGKNGANVFKKGTTILFVVLLIIFVFVVFYN